MTAITHGGPRHGFSVIRALIKEARQRQRRRHMLFAVVLVIAASGAAGGYAINNEASSSGLASACAASHCASAIPPASGVPNPCVLLTNAEAATALGTSGIQSRSSQLPPNMGASSHYRTCAWKGTPLSNAVFSDSAVQIWVSRSSQAQFLQGERSSGGVLLHGLGEAAYALDGPVRMVFVWQHGYMLWVQAADAINPIQAERKLAELALTRLH